MEEKAIDKSQGKEERILRVIEIAKRMFIEHGYSATKTVQIARESQIAELTLFRYFPTKQMLFEAVIQPLVDFEEFAQGLMNAKPLHRTDLLKLIRERINFVKRERELVRLVIIESQFQPDLAGELNPIVNVESQVRQMFLYKGLSVETSQLITQLLRGLLLSIAFTPYDDELGFDLMEELIETQILYLLEELA